MRSTIATLASFAIAANGHLLYTYEYEYESPLYARSSWADAPDSMTRSSWRMSPDYYSVKIQTPAVEEGSVSASLSPDGMMLNVNAKRRIEGCTCQESTVGQVRLPHTPRAEDVDLVHDPKTGVVSVKVARHAKAAEPTPLSIKTLEQEPKPEGQRPLRFVPHESAAPKQGASVDTAEAKVLEKFRALARAVADSKPATADDEPEKKNDTEPSPVAGYEP